MNTFKTIEEMTFTQEYQGTVQLASISKVVLTKGTWCTILYEVVDGAAEPAGYVLCRYRKKDGEYRLQNKFKLTPSTSTKLLTALIELSPDFVTEEAAEA